MRVLLIEDDRAIGSAVRDHIAAAGHAADWAPDLATGHDFRAVSGYDLVLLDLGLPDGRGIDFLKEIRRGGDTGAVIILSAQDQIRQRIEGLNAGADDYLTKPFDLAELSARVAAVARRYGGTPSPERQIGSLRVDTTHRTVSAHGQRVELSAREWAVLERIIRTPGATVAKGEIEDALYAFGAEVESNTVEVYISRLRKKLGRDSIRTLRGIGYQIATGEG
jgi:two-component system OmpR family response regulator